MLATLAKQLSQREFLFKNLRRVATVLIVTIAIAAVLNRSNESLQGRSAGFGRGVVDGALMPGTVLPLLLGRDVAIYAPNNTGRTYKLGYTVGVNGCGAIFFGLIFWRLNRWRKGRTGKTDDRG
jgi:hypothetical protein